MIKIGIVGSRRRNSMGDRNIVEAKFNNTRKSIPDERVCIVSGGCPSGGDAFAEYIAKKYGETIIIHHPNWSKYGKSAGHRRNSLIAKDSDILIACVAEDREGGTEGTIREFLKLYNSEGRLHLL